MYHDSEFTDAQLPAVFRSPGGIAVIEPASDLHVPAIITAAGSHARLRLVDFFTATIDS